MKIVVLDGYTLNPGDNPWTELATLGDLVVHDRTSLETVVERSQGAAALVVNKVRLPREVLAALPDLRFITVTATGFDIVDIQAAKERGIPVSNVPVYGTDSVAQHVLALLLYFCHRVDLHGEAVRQGEWTRCPDFCFWKTPLVELAGLTLGIIGFGRIGRRVGEVAHALGMRILAYDQFQDPSLEETTFSWTDLDTLARTSDVVSLHCPLTPDNRGMVNRDFLAKMRPTAILINASRGPLVVDEDLAAALAERRLAGAALDVVSVEPIRADNPLLSAPNCLITPHIAWATLAARKRLMATTVENMRAFLAGKPIHVVNP
ncbi:MAG: D-2-hydroxyacid dehydrogenase [Candidatus Omnitrophica bacterium]|nr:Glycerate dehydrogenase [bacterium]NUN95021.1 D-2-hydroxyacid dehydrogenase [Candidatus Omnitrophota bacterium]